MKRLFVISASLLVFVVMSCKKVNDKKMTVIRDCTGTYLRIEGKDYHVCNLSKTDNFENGATVVASYKKISDCSDSGARQIVCMMLHNNEGWIEVTNIL